MRLPERTPASLAGLNKMCLFLQERTPGLEKLVEVGGWTGAGTSIFIKHFRLVFVVDPWDARQGEIAAEENVAAAEALFDERHFQNHRVVKIKTTSIDASFDFADGEVDVVYIDALHRYDAVKADITAWFPVVKNGGWLCGHDYDEQRFPGVVKAVNERFPRSEVTTFPDTSWVVRSKS